MTVDILFALVCIVVIVIVFTSRGRKQQATTRSREQVLSALAPVVSGTLSKNLELTGTFEGHPVEASLRTTGRIDTVGTASHQSSSFEVLLLVVRGAHGEHPWGYYTSVDGGRLIGKKWLSAVTFAGAMGKMLSRLTPVPIDPGIDARLEQGGMLQALDGLGGDGAHAPYVFVSYAPTARAVARTLQRVEEMGGTLAERARHEADHFLQHEQGGHLRIEVERRGDDDPTPERFREILTAAVNIATLNATINAASESSR